MGAEVRLRMHGETGLIQAVALGVVRVEEEEIQEVALALAVVGVDVIQEEVAVVAVVAVAVGDGSD
jgi:hypothetical protein